MSDFFYTGNRIFQWFPIGTRDFQGKFRRFQHCLSYYFDILGSSEDYTSNFSSVRRKFTFTRFECGRFELWHLLLHWNASFAEFPDRVQDLALSPISPCPQFLRQVCDREKSLNNPIFSKIEELLKVRLSNFFIQIPGFPVNPSAEIEWSQKRDETCDWSKDLWRIWAEQFALTFDSSAAATVYIFESIPIIYWWIIMKMRDILGLRTKFQIEFYYIVYISLFLFTIGQQPRNLLSERLKDC
jgi:hypothetical protein